MDAKRKIELALAYAGMSKAGLARAIGTSPQNLGSKIEKGKITLDEWEKFARAMGARFEAKIIFPDGDGF